MLITLLLLACKDSSTGSNDTEDFDSEVDETDVGTETDADETDTEDTNDTEDTHADAIEAVCEAWGDARASMAEGTWTGNLGSCDAGTLSQSGLDNSLAQVNAYRGVAGLPAVSLSPQKNAEAQQCALMMHANGQLNHFPPSSWNCYNATGAGAAGQSNIASAPAVWAVDLYMGDWGNATTFGHRRWILSNGLGPIGIGSTSQYSCMEVIGGSGSANEPWLAWPPPGIVPLEAAQSGEVGWTVQSDSIDLAGARATITHDGNPMSIRLDQLLPYYGSTYAIAMVPQSWTVEEGEYDVEITGIATPISYTVEVVGCP